MNANSDRYEIFLKVAELGSITRAAEALHYTQSGVSHAVAALEREAGFALFVRTAGGVTLTDAGRRTETAVRQLVHAKRNLAETFAGINHVVAGVVRVGTIGSVAANLLPAWIRRFRAVYPAVDFEVSDGDYDDVRAGLARDVLDCGFLTETTRGDFDFHPLCTDPLVAVAARTHPLAAMQAVTAEALSAYPLVAEGNVFARDVLPLLGGALPPVRYAQNSDISALAMVEGGFGVSIFPAMTLRHYAFDVVQIPILPAVYRTVGIASKPSALLSPVTRCFLKFLAENA